MEGLGLKYIACQHIRRPHLDVNMTEEVAQEISTNYRVLPTFEKSMTDYNYRRYYSLNDNQFLKCRYIEFQKTRRYISPLQFPTNRDDHFYKYTCRIAQDQSVYNKTNFRYKLGPGPGVDFRGQQKPIPHELLMIRSDDKDAVDMRDRDKLKKPLKNAKKQKKNVALETAK